MRPIAPGDVLFQEGDRGFSFYVVLEGAVEIVEQSRGTRREVTVHEPGEFTGDVDTLSGRAVLVTGRAIARGDVLELTAAELRQAVDALPEIGEIVLKAFLTRRTLLLSDGFEGIKITRRSSDMPSHVTGRRCHPASSWLLRLAIASTSLSGCRSASEPVPPAAPAVVVATPLVTRMTEWDEYTGRFEATDRVDVRARVDGYLDSIHFRDGAIVTPGQLLFVIDPRPYEARLDGARADVVRAQTRVELTTTDFTRGEALFAIRGISQEEFDQRTQARKEAEAALIVARAAERAAALNVEFTQVRAPIGGRISEKFVSVGNVVSGGQAASTLLTTVVAIDPIHFVFDASEADYLRYNRLNASGSRRTSRETPNPVRIRLLDETAFTHVGHMDFVDNRLDTTTGTIRGRALVPNPGGFLTPGQFGRVQLLGSGEFDALLIPDSAIQTDQARRFVWTVNTKNMPEQRVIESGPLERGLRIVRAGLARADRVVINGMQRVRPGAPVAPTDGRVEPPAGR